MTTLAKRIPGAAFTTKRRPLVLAQWGEVTLLRILEGLHAYQSPDQPAPAAVSDITTATTLGIACPRPSRARPYVLTRKASR